MPQRPSWLKSLCTFCALALLCATAKVPLTATADASIALADTDDNDSLIIVLGLANSLNDDVQRTIDSELKHKNISVVDLTDQSLSSIEWPGQGIVVAAGMTGCKQTVAVVAHLDVRCVLLTEENYRTILTNEPSTSSRSVSALVIDQPVMRQARVAQRVYPALSRFAVLSETPIIDIAQRADDVLLDRSRYKPSVLLAPQLNDALTSNDALIAIPETSVFNRKTLRTVLLSAYGYGKPVVGLSRAYVKAGALITAYSTPLQIFREIAESLQSTDGTSLKSFSEDSVSYPQYFSIADNVNVAKSLRLSKLFSFDANATYSDRDFQP